MRALGWLCVMLGILLAFVLIIFSLGFLPAENVVLRDPWETIRVELGVWPDGSPNLILYGKDRVKARAELSTAALVAGFGVLILALRPPESNRITGSRAIEAGMKTCPRCAKRVPAEARVCHFCSYAFPLPELPLEQFMSGLGELIDRYAKEIWRISEEALVGSQKSSAEDCRGKVAEVQTRCYREALEMYHHLVGASGQVEEELVARLRQIKEMKERAALLKEIISSVVKPPAGQ